MGDTTQSVHGQGPARLGRPTSITGVLEAPMEDFLIHLRVEKGRSVRTLDAYGRDLRRYSAYLAERRYAVARCRQRGSKGVRRASVLVTGSLWPR
ncbi:MAG: site-specific integrase [Microthrixaceae bacterium]